MLSQAQQPDNGFPRTAIKCHNPQCRERGRVIAEPEQARLYVEGGGYVDVSVPVRCPVCGSHVKWVPSDCPALLTYSPV